MHAFALLLTGLTWMTSVAAAEPVASAYSRHEYEKCDKVGDDDPILERRCVGHDGIVVHWVNEPDTSSLSFGTDGATGGEYDARFTFAVAGSVIEWRGPLSAGSVVPYAAIVRYQLCRSVGGPCAPELVVYRLHGRRTSCIAATVNGRRTDANVRAREIADSFVPTFDCARDKRRAPE